MESRKKIAESNHHLKVECQRTQSNFWIIANRKNEQNLTHEANKALK